MAPRKAQRVNSSSRSNGPYPGKCHKCFVMLYPLTVQGSHPVIVSNLQVPTISFPVPVGAGSRFQISGVIESSFINSVSNPADEQSILGYVSGAQLKGTGLRPPS